jgi:formylglycine-generating enzyme required for sulfatase activity
MPRAKEGETDAHPMVGIRFDQAVAYTDWLSQQTGQPYRLPSEAEWEYAARAGQSGLRPGEAAPADLCTFANLADTTLAARFREWETVDCDDGHAGTAPVGRFAANAWGLHDMLGNVAEWTSTCWDSRPGAADRQDVDCGSRVVRGGSWDTPADGISFSAAEPASRESDDRGFRLLREP